MKKTLYHILTVLMLLTPALQAEQLFTQSLVDAPLEQLVDIYNEWTGRTLIIQADLTPKISLKYNQLTKDEAMQAIETVLAMNGVALVPMGDKFLKVVPIANARQEGMAILPFDDEKEYVESDQLISQIIPLRHVVFADIQAMVQSLTHSYGKIVQMDRINSVLVTDTSANVARIVEAIKMVDQPLEKIEPRIYQFKHAKATEIATKLKELVEAAKTDNSDQKTVAEPRKIPGVVRAPKTTGTVISGAGEEQTEMIQGEVKFVADERTNILIIFSKEANFSFFDRIIKVLDVPVDPEVVVEVVNLEYAEAKEISGILNDFIGAVQEDKEKKGGNATGGTDDGGGAKSVDEVIRARTQPKRELSATAQNAIGRLSADTKILSDERTNSLLLMGSKSDIEALKVVISSLDVMLEQVLIEAVILGVNLNDSIQTGIQWVYNSQKEEDSLVYKPEPYTDTNGNWKVFDRPVLEVSDKLNRFGFDAANLASNMVAGALGYYGSFPQINLQAIISAAKTDGDARILSTPIVLTTDNTEATITIADERPVITSSTSATSGYSARSTYQYKTIGIDLTVTPHINPERFVLMEIKQSADDVGGNVQVDGNDVPIIQKREISATVAVQNKETIVLGGLVRKSKGDSTTKIPLLGDIPLIGWLFSTHSKSDDRQELIVLITPYVLTNPAEATAEAKRRMDASAAKDTEWPRGWSQSPLRNDEKEPKTESDFLESIFGKDEKEAVSEEISKPVEPEKTDTPVKKEEPTGEIIDDGI